MMRLITSGGVLAEFGATKRMMPEAKLCCCASAAAPVRAQTSAATGASAVVNVGLIMEYSCVFIAVVTPSAWLHSGPQQTKISVHSAVWNATFRIAER
jgi:hypothetical protein